MRWIIVNFLLILGFYTSLCISKHGEVLNVIAGEVQKCDTLGGTKMEGMSHATIKTADGKYIISSLKNCVPATSTEIHLKRGALYFNTVYASE
jgi:hypothetical protein